MRDVLAAIAAIVLLLAAASLATTLQTFRRRRLRARAAEQDQGRAVIAEIPGDEDLVLFTADATHFHFRDHAIDKTAVVAVRVLINGAPIASYVSKRHAGEAERQATSFDDRPEGIARDRWDVAIETVSGGMTMVECGAIRERVSQELARLVFDAVKNDLEQRDA
jgi:hypothetical protein